jgi:SEC-C motif domain protein
MTKLKDPCPCFSGKEYFDCCRPFHESQKLPKNALELMKSRYSAYALNLPDYIISTTHKDNPQYSEDKESWKKEITKFSKEFIFNGLKIIDFKEEKNEAIVISKAYLSKDSNDATFIEKSYFEKVNNKWLYKNGEINSKFEE